jgi:hypothetical protein
MMMMRDYRRRIRWESHELIVGILIFDSSSLAAFMFASLTFKREKRQPSKFLRHRSREQRFIRPRGNLSIFISLGAFEAVTRRQKLIAERKLRILATLINLSLDVVDG